MPRPQAEHRTNLAKAYYALDDKITLECGVTDRTRIRRMVICNCQITERSFYRWLEKPEDIRRSDRQFLSYAFNKSIKKLFDPQLNLTRLL